MAIDEIPEPNAASDNQNERLNDVFTVNGVLDRNLDVGVIERAVDPANIIEIEFGAESYTATDGVDYFIFNSDNFEYNSNGGTITIDGFNSEEDKLIFINADTDGITDNSFQDGQYYYELDLSFILLWAPGDVQVGLGYIIDVNDPNNDYPLDTFSYPSDTTSPGEVDDNNLIYLGDPFLDIA